MRARPRERAWDGRGPMLARARVHLIFFHPHAFKTSSAHVRLGCFLIVLSVVVVVAIVVLVVVIVNSAGARCASTTS